MATFIKSRYESMPYNRCGRWSVKLPAISLGAWQTYGGYVFGSTTSVTEAVRTSLFNLIK